MRRQFLIVKNKDETIAGLAYINFWEQFTDCVRVKDVTPYVECEAISGLASLDVGALTITCLLYTSDAADE